MLVCECNALKSNLNIAASFLVLAVVAMEVWIEYEFICTVENSQPQSIVLHAAIAVQISRVGSTPLTKTVTCWNLTYTTTWYQSVHVHITTSI